MIFISFKFGFGIKLSRIILNKNSGYPKILGIIGKLVPYMAS